jgi:hypothetical protein
VEIRKLVNFYRICYCYLLLFPVFVVLSFITYFGMFAFLFVDSEKFFDITNKFSTDISKLIEDKVKEIKREEFDILNEDTPYCTRCKHVSWRKEIIFTLVVICVVVIVAMFLI